MEIFGPVLLGPWQPIARDLANTGRHAWKLPAGSLPTKVYLRIRARDLAGNEGVAATPEPLVLDLSEPEAQIVSVLPKKK